MSHPISPQKQTTVWHDVTAQTLQEEIIPLYKPAILKGAAKHWQVIEQAAQSPLNLMAYRHAHGKPFAPIELYIGEKEINGRYSYGNHVDEFNFKHVQSDFAGLLKHLDAGIKEAAPITAYAGAIDVRSQLPSFEVNNSFNILTANLDFVPKAWIGNAAQISTHFDVQDNIACLVSGQRTFTLFPPEQLPNLYVGPLDKSIAGPPVSMVNMESPDFNKHPRYHEALAHGEVAELEIGDALYIPSLWWHSVKSAGNFCMLVNYWWNNPQFRKDNTMMALIHGLYSISHLPKNERRAWKAFFDYYVFKLEDEPLEHLPENQRGVNGPMTPALYNIIGNYLMQSMGAKR